MKIILLLFFYSINGGQCGSQKSKINNMTAIITYEEAKKIALEKMDSLSDKGSEIMLWEEKTITKPYGWIFIFSTRKYIATKNPDFLIPGLPNLIVEKSNGSVTLTPSSIPLETFIKEFEKKF